MAQMEKFLKDPAQYVQLDSMLKDRKSAKEIVEFFKTTYSINVPSWVVYQRKRIVFPPKKVELSLSTPRKKKAGKVSSTPEQDTPRDELTEAIGQLETELKMFCLRIRMVARREILKYVARIRKARMASGENISEEENKRLYQELESLKISKEEVKEVQF
jgi:hypothetical protein